MADNHQVKERRNRALFPIAAAMLDEFRQVFGMGVQITYAEEGGHVVGKPVEQRLQGTWISLKDIETAKPKTGKTRR